MSVLSGEQGKVIRSLLCAVQMSSSDIRAQELLMQVCNDPPLVLDDPPTIVTFEGFGDISLNFVVRAFLPNRDSRLHP